MATVNAWTRERNDSIATAYDASRQDTMFKYITYHPTYLTSTSCMSGNSANCHVYRAPDLTEEQRIGLLTNKRESQRATTTNPALGIPTAPDFSRGKLIDARMLHDMTILEPKARYGSRVIDMPPQSQVTLHHLDDSRAHTVGHHPAFGREDIYVSSRVQRRNAFARIQ